MQASILAFQQRWATKRVLVVLAVIYIIFPLYLLPLILPEGRPLDLYLYYSPTEAFRLIASYGELNRQAYIIGSLTIDTIYPLFYSTLLGLLLTFFISPCYSASDKRQMLRLFPYAILVVDILENLAIVSLLASFPQINEFVAIIASSLTFIKWLLSLLTILLIVYFAVQFYRVVKSKNEIFDKSARR